MYKNAAYPVHSIPTQKINIPRWLANALQGEHIGVVTIHGDCMAGAGIEDGDFVMFAEDRFPKEGSACICSCPYWNNGAPMVKRYDRQRAPGVFSVRACYKDAIMQGGADCDKIYGVVVACLSHDGTVKWALDVNDFGREPDAVNPFKAGNCSLPPICCL